jgi:sialidase-1
MAAYLTRLHSGELFVTYSGGREAHVCPFGRVEIIRKADLLLTFRPPSL